MCSYNCRLCYPDVDTKAPSEPTIEELRNKIDQQYLSNMYLELYNKELEIKCKQITEFQNVSNYAANIAHDERTGVYKFTHPSELPYPKFLRL